jgi:hypothetical protein
MRYLQQEPLRQQAAIEQRELEADQTLITSLCDSVRVRFTEMNTVQLRWQALTREYEERPFVNAGKLWKKMFALKLNEKKTKDYVNQIMDIRLQLISMGQAVADELVVNALFGGLGKKHKSLVDAYSTRNNITVQEAVAIRSKLDRSDSDESENDVREEDQSEKAKNINGKPVLNVQGAKQRWNPKHTNNRNNKGRCHVCGKKGHWVRDCWHKNGKD